MEIALEGVSVRYGQRNILDNMSLTIAAGSVVAVVGPSGSGKTSLLRLMIGMIRPQTGVVKVERAPIDYAHVAELRRRVGYVMQEAGLFPHMTVEQNITLLARLDGWATDRRNERAKTLVQSLGLDGELLARFPQTLSGGQRQRVAMARALMLDPPVLLLDEPFAALDPVVRRELQDQFVALQAQLRKTVVWVTHDFSEAYRVAERIVLLNGGRVEQDSPREQFAKTPTTTLARAFVHSAQGLT